jgi:hypothetical protein
MPLAIRHRLRVDFDTSRRFTCYPPEIPLILAGFPNLPSDRVHRESSGAVEKVDSLARWQNHCRIRPKPCKAQYGSANPNVEPAGWSDAWRTAEEAALALMEKRDRSRAQVQRDAKPAKEQAKPAAKPRGRPRAERAEEPDDALAAMSGGSIPPFNG